MLTTPIAEKDVRPLSFAQRGLWFLHRLRGGTPEYCVPHVVRLHGRLNRVAFERALNVLVARHEALRTYFDERDGVPMQVVLPELTVTMSCDDLACLGPSGQEAGIAAIVRRENAAATDISRPPLLRVRLIRLGDEQHVMVRTLHHIVSDGWSDAVFTRE